MLAPFDNHGNLMHYPETIWGHNEKLEWIGTEPTWQELPPFYGEYRFDSYHRGRSAVYFQFREKGTDRLWPMFLTDLADVLKTVSIDKGLIRGTWEVCKRGQNYGIRRVSA